MAQLRALLLHHRRLAVLLIGLALCVKALVPAGFMVAQSDRVLTIQICADSLGHQLTKQIIVPGSGHDSQTSDKTGADGPCHFAANGHALIGATDPVQLALALLFIIAMGFVAHRWAALPRWDQSQPPLRGPPASV